VKKILIQLFRFLGFSVKVTTIPNLEKYKVHSQKSGLLLYDTPTGKYYLPGFVKKDFVANAIKQGELFDSEIIEVAEKFIKPGSSVLDVGANYGQMTVVLSKAIEKAGSGKVYSFEAEPFVGEILKHNIEINGCSNVQTHLNAVYDKAGEELIFPEPDFKQFDSFGSYGLDPTAKAGRKVKTITIDSLNIEEPVCFIKIDIQGADLFALRGAKQTILKHKPAIIFEYEEQFQEAFNTSFQDYVSFVDEIGYRFEKTYMAINFLIVPKD
jgi:FkbM family methyltransferase